MPVNRKVLTVTSIVLIIAFTSIILYSASTFTNPYYTVSEVTADPAGFTGRRIQMIGQVVNGSIWIGSGTLQFKIAEGGSELIVIYSGSMPQNFQEGISVVTVGNLVSENTFQATQILTKCPSKYQ